MSFDITFGVVTSVVLVTGLFMFCRMEHHYKKEQERRKKKHDENPNPFKPMWREDP